MKIKFKESKVNLTEGLFGFVLLLVLSVALITPATVTAGTENIFEGTLQGATCVHYKKKCPEDDAHIALEKDFVLLLQDGSHYFLPNLDRAIKARYVAKDVRISGEVENHEVWVKRLDVKKRGKYVNVWSWEKQQELYKGGGG